MLAAILLRVFDALHYPFVRSSANDPYHTLFEEFRVMVDAIASPSVLEIGSRDVSGTTRRSLFPSAGEFVGLDIHPGAGVDIVGDAHQLSRILPAERFDAIFAISVFEHLLFPWKVVLEMNEVLKPGGLVFISTHPAWPAHELPWDFWRYQPAAFRGLFNTFTGFEILAVADGLPCQAYSLVKDRPTRPLFKHRLNQGVSALVRKVGPARHDLMRWDLNVADVLDTSYPRRE